MRTIAFLVLLGTLVLAVTSCDVGSVTIGKIETGPTVTEKISVPVPEEGIPQVVIGMGGGELDLTVGDTGKLVQGTVDYNVEEIKPNVLIEGERIRIEQGDLEGKNIPIGNWKDVENRWDLTLGTAPLELTVNAGAAKARLTHLADLGAAKIRLVGGAGDFSLEFTGSLRQDMEVTVEAGAARIALVVPEGTAAQLTFEGALTDIDTDGDWVKSGSQQYRLDGEGPRITFVVKMGVGKLDLRNR